MDSAKVAAHIIQWMSDYLRNAGVKGFVVGVSGGVDSAVTSALAARSGYPLLCVEMPIHQNKNQVDRALEHIHKLQQHHANVSYVSVDLSEVFDAFIGQLPRVSDSEERQMSLVNSRARLRMTTLYYFAALHGYLVLGTGNKVEDFGVGFFTKYGDGGVDLSPIADINKSQVYELAKYLEVPQSIQQAPPTDGLWGDDRTDEDQIGASYPELEWAMRQVEAGQRPEAFAGREREVFEIYWRLHRANQHKMKPVPVCMIPDDLLA